MYGTGLQVGGSAVVRCEPILVFSLAQAEQFLIHGVTNIYLLIVLSLTSVRPDRLLSNLLAELLT